MITQTLPKAWKLFTENKKYLGLIIIIELIFLSLFGTLQYYLFYPSGEAANRAGEIIAQEMQKLQESEVYQLESILANNPEFMQAYNDLLKALSYFVFGVLILWIIFKGLSWHLAHKSVLRKIKLQQTWWKFALLSAFWFAIIMAILLIYGLLEGSAALIPMESATATTWIMTLIFLLIFYFAQISFALIPAQQTFKNTFVYGWKHAKTIIPGFLVNLLITFIFLTIPFTWPEFAPKIGIQPYTKLFTATILITVIVSILALAFARLHMIVTTWEKQ